MHFYVCQFFRQILELTPICAETSRHLLTQLERVNVLEEGLLIHSAFSLTDTCIQMPYPTEGALLDASNATQNALVSAKELERAFKRKYQHDL